MDVSVANSTPAAARYMRRNERGERAKELWEDYVKAVDASATGRWRDVYLAKAPGLHPALAKPKGHVSCPVHGGKNGDAFRIVHNHRDGLGHCNTCGSYGGFRMLQWVNNWNFGQAVRETGDVLGMRWEDVKAEAFGGSPGTYQAPAVLREAPPPPPGPTAAELRRQRRRDERAFEGLSNIIASGKKIDWSGDNPVTRYMVHRSLEGICEDPPHDVLWIEGLEYDRSVEILDDDGQPVRGADGMNKTRREQLGESPALLLIVRDPAGAIVGAHRQWITEDGRKRFHDWDEASKGPKPDAKRLVWSPSFFSPSTAAVRLYPAGHTLGLAEGLETSLAARLLMSARQGGRKIPMWCGLNAGGLESVVTPDYVGSHIVFGDNDEAGSGIRRRQDGTALGRGEEAGRALRARLLNRGGARILLPARVGEDWADVNAAYRRWIERLNSRYATVFPALAAPAAPRAAPSTARERDIPEVSAQVPAAVQEEPEDVVVAEAPHGVSTEPPISDTLAGSPMVGQDDGDPGYSDEDADRFAAADEYDHEMAFGPFDSAAVDHAESHLGSASEPLGEEEVQAESKQAEPGEEPFEFTWGLMAFMDESKPRVDGLTPQQAPDFPVVVAGEMKVHSITMATHLDSTKKAAAVAEPTPRPNGPKLR